MSAPVLGAQLRIAADLSEAEAASLPCGDVAWFTARRPGREGPNEDSLAVLPIADDAVVLVVADGAGGLRGGADASALAVRSLQQALEEARGEGWMLRTAILNGIEQANQAVVDLGVGAATTLAAVEIQAGRARPYHVGDSPILWFGGRSKLKLETVSHSPVGFAVEAGLLEASDAMHHEDRHLVSNLLGAPDMRIEVGSSRPLAVRDTLLLASDGLSDNLLVEEMAQVARQPDLRNACDELASIARRRMFSPEEGEPSKPDDLALLLFRPKR
jgi:serine/threonine protein phosphatase PrpC